ncbi:MAG: hypothetical protein ABEJ81_04130 [Haloferacaceae archaeon]
MFDVPVDGWYAWLGVAAASVAVLVVVLGLPTAPPPDAAGAANVVDRIAVTEYGASAEHPLDAASEVRLTPRGIALRNDAGETDATFVYGPVTPVPVGGPLRRVLDGTPPGTVFDTLVAFRRAAATARDRQADWRPVDGRLIVRHVVLGGTDVTLVSA